MDIRMEERFQMKTAVAMIIFNRPDTTKEVFEAIRQAKPPKLYIISDAPREGREEEKKKVAETRSYVEEHVDWECEVIKNYAEANMGCKKRVASGITWLFEKEEAAIILEDDCVPKQEFFRYAQEMLEKYKDDESVYMVSGTNDLPGYEIKGDYAFSHFASIWGWASWRRAWSEHYDINMAKWPKAREEKRLRSLFGNALQYKLFVRDADKIHAGLVDTWDMQWVFTILDNHGAGITPKGNLIHNIGCGREDATHTKDNSREVSEYGEFSFPITFAEEVVVDREYEKHYTKKFYGIKRVFNAVKQKFVR